MMKVKRACLPTLKSPVTGFWLVVVSGRTKWRQHVREQLENWKEQKSSDRMKIVEF